MKNSNNPKFREGCLALLFILLSALLSSCSTKVYTPELKTDFTSDASVTFGDFKYNCKVTKTADYLSVTPVDTAAAGMVIRCDGSTVTFTKGSMKREFPAEKITPLNPAVLMYEVFNSLDTAESKVSDGELVFSGTISAGEFVLTASKSGDIKKLAVNSAKIEIVFSEIKY